jgi:hypothetical protein
MSQKNRNIKTDCDVASLRKLDDILMTVGVCTAEDIDSMSHTNSGPRTMLDRDGSVWWSEIW